MSSLANLFPPKVRKDRGLPLSSLQKTCKEVSVRIETEIISDTKKMFSCYSDKPIIFILPQMFYFHATRNFFLSPRKILFCQEKAFLR